MMAGMSLVLLLFTFGTINLQFITYPDSHGIFKINNKPCIY